MRIWSVHPSYLDAKGLVAVWRETLLARKVLMGLTWGYRHHPQLERFRNYPDPVGAVDAYLTVVAEEGARRGYRFDTNKIEKTKAEGQLQVTRGQLIYETRWLKTKLAVRDPDKYKENGTETFYKPHPLFQIIDGEAEPWEKQYDV